MGGIIQAKIKHHDYFPACTRVKILVKEWQGGKVIQWATFARDGAGPIPLETYLNELTTSYHASKIVEWVKENAWQHNVLVTMEGRN